MRIEALYRLHIRRAAGDLHLRPGVPIELSDEEGAKLLEKIPAKVRLVPFAAKVIEPAVNADGAPLRPVYWETGTGEILGPTAPELFAKDGDTFWISVTFKESVRWINADMLRSKTTFEQQCKPVTVERIKECR
jgi:hypothetical protein